MTLANPLVSIILPVYNRRHLVQRAIHSILRQTIQDWELLIIDDGSTDGLEEDVLPLVFDDARIRYMKHANRKLAASRNIGLHAALGRYITFLDSDDEYQSDHLQQRLTYLDEHPEVDVLHGGVRLVGSPESFYVIDAFNPKKKIHLSECCIGATLFGKKSFFLAVGGFKELPYSAESELLLRLSKHGTVHKVDFPTYVYHTGLEDSICTLRKNNNG